MLRAPVLEGVRPTSSRVREALFSMVGQDLSGLRVLDAFGGTGLLGFEAWSRGAEVVIAELRAATARQIEATARHLNASVDVRSGDVAHIATSGERFHGVLADPPYAEEPGRWLPMLGPLALDWLVWEAEERRVAPPTAGALVLDRVRSFGGTALWIYRRPGGA